MSSKKVSFGSQPAAKVVKAATLDEWAGEEKPKPKKKRITFDVPAELHYRMKMECLKRHKSIRDVALEWAEREFPEEK